MSSGAFCDLRAMRFRATLLSNGKTATGIRIPPEVIAALGPSRKPAVRVTIAGHTYRSTVATRGGEFLVGSARRTARARTFFDTLTPSQKQWYVLPIEQAKAAETRERRLAKAIGMLREGHKR